MDTPFRSWTPRTPSVPLSTTNPAQPVLPTPTSQGRYHLRSSVSNYIYDTATTVPMNVRSLEVSRRLTARCTGPGTRVRIGETPESLGSLSTDSVVLSSLPEVLHPWGRVTSHDPGVVLHRLCLLRSVQDLDVVSSYSPRVGRQDPGESVIGLRGSSGSPSMVVCLCTLGVGYPD